MGEKKVLSQQKKMCVSCPTQDDPPEKNWKELFPSLCQCWDRFEIRVKFPLETGPSNRSNRLVTGLVYWFYRLVTRRFDWLEGLVSRGNFIGVSNRSHD